LAAWVNISTTAIFDEVIVAITRKSTLHAESIAAVGALHQVTATRHLYLHLANGALRNVSTETFDNFLVVLSASASMPFFLALEAHALVALKAV